MNIVVRESKNDVDAYVAMIMASRIMLNPGLVIALATGNTTKSLYQVFADMVKFTGLKTQELQGLAVDEYWGLQEDDSIGCFARLKNAFVDAGILKRSSLFGPLTMGASTCESVCEKYDVLIRKIGGIDLQILGVGNNGHLGFNEPGTPFASTTHRVSLSQGTRMVLSEKYHKSSFSQIPEEGITMGLGTIMLSREIVLLIKGEQKASIAKSLISDPVTEAIPASILQVHPCCTVVLDREAARLI
jgi:glucosamine-6-phosphate deaminase